MPLPNEALVLAGEMWRRRNVFRYCKKVIDGGWEWRGRPAWVTEGEYLPGHVDAIGRWWPNPCEVESCCREWGKTKFPGTKFPKNRALRILCLSYRHVATKFGVSPHALRAYVRALDVMEALQA